MALSCYATYYYMGWVIGCMATRARASGHAAFTCGLQIP